MEDCNFCFSSVSDSCIVRAKKAGQAVIKVVTAFDFLNFDEVIIEVSTPSALAVFPIFPVDVSVGTQLHVAVTLKRPSRAHVRVRQRRSPIWQRVGIDEDLKEEDSEAQVIENRGRIPLPGLSARQEDT